jgi:hypothetical protein
MRLQCIVLTTAALTLAAAAQAEVKVAVVPFAPLTGDVPVKAGAKAAELLSSELKNAGPLAVAELSVEPNEAAQKSLQAARDAVTEAQGLEKRRRFGAAAASYRKAIAAYDAAAPLVTDVAELSDAHLALGTVLYLTGDDAGGAKELWNAISLTPARSFPGEATSALFASTVKKIRERVLGGDRGALQITSFPPGVGVSLDGQDLGRTPLTIKDVPAGKHLWRVLLPSAEPTGGVLTVVGNQKQKVAATLTSNGPVSKLISALATNKLDDAALALATQVSAGSQADLLVFGALMARGQDLVMESFVFAPAKKAFVRLPQKTFDSEMISAGMEIFKVAGEIAARTEELGAPDKAPAKVCAEVPPPEAAEQSEVGYAQAERDRPSVEPDRKGPRRPVDPTKAGGGRTLRPRDK